MQTSEISAIDIPGKNLVGLVVCGGKSKRMGMDKSNIVYHIKPQWQHMADMLSDHCDQVYISCNEIQKLHSESQHYRFITDAQEYKDIGPMAALLTAWSLFPVKNLLVTGCDYPFLNKKELLLFLPNCSGVPAVSFYNAENKIYEPLLAWYNHSLHEKILSLFNVGEYSLQHLLKTVDAKKYFPENILSISDANTPEDYRKALDIIN